MCNTCGPVKCFTFTDSKGDDHKILCPNHINELITEGVPEVEPKTVHDCVVNKVFDKVDKEAILRGEIILQKDRRVYESIIRHTLNMALEICK
jgi:hypothetical protein